MVASMTSNGVVPRNAIRRYVVGVVGDLAPGPEGADQPGSGGDSGDGGDRADEHGEPDPVDALAQRAPQVAGANVAGHGRGGAVGEEHAEPDRRLQHGTGDAEAGQLRGAEVADEGGVGEQEERLGDQGEERRDGQPEDLAVGSAAVPARVRAGCCGARTAPRGTSRGGAYGWVVSSSQK